MKEPKRRQSLSGAVLIMILTIMFILIILLTATLTTVTTANQRIYTKFEENQAYYTARSALDVFTQYMLDDSNYYVYDNTGALMTYQYTDDETTPGSLIISSPTNMKQGLALQQELYKITSKGEQTALIAAKHDPNFKKADGTPTTAAYGALGWAENMIETDNVFGNLTDGSDAPENATFSIEQTNPLNNETAASGKQFDYIEYQITLPEVSNGSNKYGKIVDKNASSGDQIATIRVEVLNRVYNTSPSYTVEDMIDIVNGTNAADKQALKDAIKNGDRAKDKLRLKVTATVQYNGTEGTAVLIYDTYEPKTVATSRAITSLSDLSSGSGMFPIGGASALSSNEVVFNDDSVVTGSVYLQGSYRDASNNNVYVDGSTVWFVKDNFTITNKYPAIKQPGAVIFAGGTMSLGVAGSLGDTTNKVNLIAQTITFGSNSPTIYGNVFCDVLDVSSANLSNLRFNGITFANSIKPQSSGWYDSGNDALNLTITYPQDPVTVSSSSIISTCHDWGTSRDFSIDYNISTGATSVTEVTGGISIPFSGAVSVTTSGTTPNVDASKKVNIDINDYTTTPVTAEMTREFNLPGNLVPAQGATAESKVTIPTVANLYKDFFDPSAFNGNGEFDVTYVDPSSPTQAEFDSFINSNVITAEQKLSLASLDKYSNDVVVEARNSATENTYPASEQIPVTFTNVITGSGKLKQSDNNGNGNNYGLIAIDARTDPIEIQINDDSVTGDTYYAGQFVVYGDKEVTFLLAGNKKINLGSSAGSCKFEVYSSEIYNASVLNLGNTTNPTSAPKVNFYVASTVPEVSMGTSSFICGYFHMPMSQFGFAGGMNGKSYSTNYDGYSIGSVAYGVVGSIFCSSYTSSQKVGVAYIDPSSENIDPSDPFLNWQAYQYVRN